MDSECDGSTRGETIPYAAAITLIVTTRVDTDGGFPWARQSEGTCKCGFICTPQWLYEVGACCYPCFLDEKTETLRNGIICLNSHRLVEEIKWDNHVGLSDQSS